MNTSKNLPVERPYYHNFEAGNIYHFYNRSNNKEQIFQSENSILNFLSGFEKYLLPYIEIYAYCIMPNHFHIVGKIKQQSEVIKMLNSMQISQLSQIQKSFIKSPNERLFNYLIGKQFGNLCNSFAKGYNSTNKRHGNVFNANMNRIRVENSSQLKWLIYYIHSNPWHHGLMEKFENYFWSSFYEIKHERWDIISSSIHKIFKHKKGFFEYHNMAHEMRALKSVTFPTDHGSNMQYKKVG